MSKRQPIRGAIKKLVFEEIFVNNNLKIFFEIPKDVALKNGICIFEKNLVYY